MEKNLLFFCDQKIEEGQREYIEKDNGGRCQEFKEGDEVEIEGSEDQSHGECVDEMDICFFEQEVDGETIDKYPGHQAGGFYQRQGKIGGVSEYKSIQGDKKPETDQYIRKAFVTCHDNTYYTYLEKKNQGGFFEKPPPWTPRKTFN